LARAGTPWLHGRDAGAATPPGGVVPGDASVPRVRRGRRARVRADRKANRRRVRQRERAREQARATAAGDPGVDGRLDGCARARRPVTPRRTLSIGAALLGLVGLMAIVLAEGPLALDRHWSSAMHDLRTSFLTNVALVFNASGQGLGRLLSIAAVAVVLAVMRRWFALAVLLGVEAVTPLSSSALRAATGRPRPPDGLVHPMGSSFPSGHTAYAGATCVALVLL